MGVLAQSASSCAAQLLTIRAWAARHGLEVVDLGTSAEPNGADAGCQLVIALGGDGTILRALQVAMAQHAAVLGVNFGHVGFLADISGDELAEALERVAVGQALLDERTALVARDRGGAGAPVHRLQRRGGRAPARLRAGPAARGGRRRVAAGPAGRRDRHRVADRARRPTRSGPAVRRWRRPSTPSSSRRWPRRAPRCARSWSTAARSSASSSSPAARRLSIEIDGRETHAMPAPAPLEIRAAARKARLVRTRPRTFYRDLATRL